MEIKTSKFGVVEVDDQRVLHFADGLVGFPSCRRFAIIQTGDNGVFFWMQCVERQHLAFVVCDPRTFVPDYNVSIKPDELQAIGLTDLADTQVLVIVNKIDNTLSGNLQGPLIINMRNMNGRQLILSDKKYGTRHVLMTLGEEKAAMSKTA